MRYIRYWKAGCKDPWANLTQRNKEFLDKPIIAELSKKCRTRFGK